MRRVSSKIEGKEEGGGEVVRPRIASDCFPWRLALPAYVHAYDVREKEKFRVRRHSRRIGSTWIFIWKIFRVHSWSLSSRRSLSALLPFGSRPMLTTNGDIFLRKSLISLPRFLPYQAYTRRISNDEPASRGYRSGEMLTRSEFFAARTAYERPIK